MRSLSIVLGVSLAACSPAVEFPVPPIEPAADETDRAAQYDDYRLSLTGNWFTGYRYTSPYAAGIFSQRSRPPARLDTTQLFARYEDTDRVRRMSQGFAFASLGAVVVGGALVGVALGAVIADPHNTGFLPGAERIGVGVGGAGLLLLGFVFTGVSLAQYRQLGPLYNHNLRRELGLTAGAPQQAPTRLVWGPGGVGLAW